jgi:Fe-coproporphyrin III synthase
LEVKTERSNSLECVDDTQSISALPVLVVHAHSSCNCRCVMCDIWKSKETRTFGMRELEPQLESIRSLGVRWIVFSGGEPLMNPELPELCATLRREGIRLTLLSTGLLLKNNAGAVAASFDDVILSLDGPRKIHDMVRRVDGAFALLEMGVRALREVRRDMRITARTTVQQANHRSLLETARTADTLSLNGISFLAVDVTTTAFNRALTWPKSRQEAIGLSLPELTALENEIERLIRASQEEFAASFIAESPGKLWRIVRHFRSQLGLELPESPLCNAPWVSAVIETDGAVRPCFFHEPIGNLEGSTLEAVINGATARQFRQNLDIPNDPICRNCVCSLNYRS